jgi:hypothetical protein
LGNLIINTLRKYYILNMKNLNVKHLAGVLVVSLLAASCQKEQSEVRRTETPEICNFNMKTFNMSVRPETDALIMASKRKYTKPTTGTTDGSGGTTGGTDSGTGGTTGGTDGGTTGGTTGGTDGGGTTYQPAPNSVILLDFDGHYVTNAYWNGGAPISARYSGMNSSEIQATIARVQEDYSPFNVTVTNDESVYNAADPTRRVRVIITESWEWYGQAGGVAYLGSFTWGNETPAWVFSSLLSYNGKYVGEAAAHEAGHTLGLYHQAKYEGGVKTTDYHSGSGTGETSWAPIMGVGYYTNLTIWHNGMNSNGQNQDDLGIITQTLPFKGDDFGNSTSSAAPLGTSMSGLINVTNDVDVFYYDGAINNIALRSNGNVDLQYTIYNGSGQAVATGNDVDLLGTSASVYLPYGRYYVAVTSVANSNTSTYGMLGTYSVSVQ